jgi:hypothetical protein
MVKFNGENDRLVLGNHDIETAYLTLKVTDRAPSAYSFLEKIIYCYPPEAQFVDLEGESATKIKQEIVQVLGVAVKETTEHPHFVIAATGLLQTLRGEDEEQQF